MKKKKIFIVEDSNIVRELLAQEMRNNFNCEISLFSNSKDLLSNLLTQPDVIILDYFLDQDADTPDENGKSIIKKIKLINKNIPVIIFSGQRELKVAIELIEDGAVDYIDKNDNNFLEEIIGSVKNIFEFNKSSSFLNKIKNSSGNALIQFFGLMVISIFFIIIIISN